MRKNIVIAPCSNKMQLYKDHWMKEDGLRDFDVCLLFYQKEIEHPEQHAQAEYFFHLQDFKFKMIYSLLTSVRPDFLDQYEYFYFIDEDVIIETKDINSMFGTARVHDLWITQASLSHDSFCSWPILKSNKNCYLRFLGQVEVMAPLFSRYALKECIASFTVNDSSWGMDIVWSKLLGYPTNRIAVIDSIRMKHTLPVGGGELYTKLKADPEEEWDNAIKSNDAIKNAFYEHGRYLIVDNNHFGLLRLIIRLRGKLRTARQAYLNLGIGYRIKNRLGMKV